MGGHTGRRSTILVIAQVEDPYHIEREIEKQTVQPDYMYIYHDKHPAKGINNRRKRIARNHKILKDAVASIQCDYVWQVEGDCILPENALERLIIGLDELREERVGFLSAAQVGRHGVYAIGGWIFEDDEHFHSVDYKVKDIQEVHGAGFYCLLSKKDVWLKGNASWNGERWGPDVNFGLSLTNKGYRNFLDTRIEIGHATSRGMISVSDPSTCNVKFFKKDGIWKYEVYDI
jgi:hypothetical protein